MSLLKAQKRAEAKGKRKADHIVDDADDTTAAGPSKKVKKNKQRVLLLSSRGVTHRMRHLMNDIETLLPHVKKGTVYLLSVLRVDNHYQTPSWIPKAS